MNTSTPATPTEIVVQIRAEMARQDMTLPQLADQLGVAYSTLYRRFAAPDRLRYRDFIDIAHVLDVPVSVLFARAEERAA